MKLIEGTFRPDRANPREPRVTVLARMTPPSWIRRLGDAGVAVHFWRRCVPKLVKAGVLAETDVEAFAVVCETYSLYRRAVTEIPKSFSGHESFPLAITVRNQTLKSLHHQLMAFGLNPVARSKVIAGGDLDLPVPAGAQVANPAGGRDDTWLRAHGAAAPA